MSGLLLRPEQPGEEPAVEDVVRAAFGPDGEQVAALVRDLRRSDAWLGLSFVAEREGELIGHVAFTGALLDAPPRLVDVLVLSPLGVVPPEQGRGAGAALVRHGLAALAGGAEPLVFLEGSPGQVLPLPSREAWMTGTLVYPDAFWRHDCVGLREPRT